MKKAYGYIRVSTEDQANRGLSIEAQKEAIRVYCEHAEYELCGGASDAAHGADVNRRGLWAVVDMLEKGDVLVVAKRDRLARDQMLAGLIEKEVKKRGASIVSVAGEGTEGDGPADKLMRQIIDAFAEYERAIISFRTTSALDAKRRRGEITGSAPFGYRRESPESQNLVEDQKEQQIIDIVTRMRKDGRSWEKIANAVNKFGYRTRGGGRFTRQGLWQMLGESTKSESAS